MPQRLRKLLSPSSGFSLGTIDDKTFKLESYYSNCYIKVLTYDINRINDSDFMTPTSMRIELIKRNLIDLKTDISGNKTFHLKNGGKVVELGYFWNNFHKNDRFNPVLKKHNRRRYDKEDIQHTLDLEENQGKTWKEISYEERKPMKGQASNYLAGYMEYMVRKGIIDVDKDYISLMTRYAPDDGLIKFYNSLGFEKIGVIHSKCDVMMGKFSTFYSALKNRNKVIKMKKRQRKNALKTKNTILKTQKQIQHLHNKLDDLAQN